MSYLFSDFSSEDRVSLLELEITRLQDLCRKNFAMMDEMRKESKKLQEVHTELKETTSDLAYTLASVQCPWQNEVQLQSAVKVLASFAQKIQYILELPTFIDPIEQLEKNGRLGNHRVTNILKRTTRCQFVRRVKTCKKCRKKFRKISSYETHSRLPGHGCGKIKKIKCRFCVETFQSYIAFKIHLKNFHSFPEKFIDDEDDRKEQLSIAEFFKKNHVRVWRFIKCQVCDTVCSSITSLKNHQKYCRILVQKDVEQQQQKSSKATPPSIIVPAASTHKSFRNPSNDKHKESPSKNHQSTAELIDLTCRPHLLVTLHEEFCGPPYFETEVALLPPGHHTTNKDNDNSQKPTECTPITPVLKNNNSHENNNENVTTDPDPCPSVEPMTVAEAPVRLSSMHAFSINTTTATSSASSSTTIIPSSNSMAASKSAAVPTADHNGHCGNGMDTLEGSSNKTSTNNVSTNAKKISTTTTMCFLPSSSSSWESDKDQPSPSPTSSQGTTQCQVSEGGVLLNGHKFTCSHRNCTRSFLTRGKLFHHEKTHTEIGESRSFSCQLCSKVFKDKYRLKTHFFTHCSDNSIKPMYRCLECGVFHDSLKELARHTEVDHSESKLKEPRYQCPSCAFYTNFRCKLDLHRKSSHQCRVASSSSRSKTATSTGGGDGNSSRVGGYTVFRDSSLL